MAQVASTTGMQTAAKAGANAAPAVVASTQHTFVCMRTFPFYWNLSHLTYQAGTRYVVDAAHKVAIQASGADVVWDN
jgi:hypothetical protein